MTEILVAPSILSADFAYMGEAVKNLKKSSLFLYTQSPGSKTATFMKRTAGLRDVLTIRRDFTIFRSPVP